ncbi:tRNA 2-selenouridine(34) synthase MnmH [Gorillibacterium massiliense]|uniref:tRNA 2-selenouridine(34) synthase MnmH n=1 Tax=Gorillibacterium massiliense TaxID=1280390 RepID=UPI0004B465EE|nr:tRNA 2-selenouridine(34) synthase MnmH [Gorillibacterium massiliense]
MFQDIAITDLLKLQQKEEVDIIDVRSPSEFLDMTLPGSRNIPLFDDEERRDIGTLYTQVGMSEAKVRGLEVVSAKLPAFIREFDSGSPKKAVFCWRGGMRSRTAATLLSLYGFKVYRLDGGIRAYRQWVVDQLQKFTMHPECIVLGGLTGTGKTDLLQRLAAKGYPVLDLEGMAGHRGSIFGGIGMQPRNQKTFDSLLLHKLLEVNESPFVLIEGESRRIGKVVMPSFLAEKKERGKLIVIDMPVATRVQNILKDYRPEENKEDCIGQFRRIADRIHTPVSKEIMEHLQMDRFAEAVELLLVHYYDPRYLHSAEGLLEAAVTIRVDSVDEAEKELIHQLPALKSVP